MPANSLTEAAVRAFASRNGERFEMSDLLCRGLRLRVSPSGKVWSVMLRVAGKVERVTLGPYPDLSLREARDKALTIRLKRAQGRSPAKAEKSAAQLALLTIDDLCVRYLAAKSSMRSIGQYEAFLKPFRMRFGERAASEAGRGELLSWFEATAMSSPVSSNRQLAIVRALFYWSVDREILHSNPLARVKLVAAEHSRERVLSKAEIKAFWHATGGDRPLTPEAAGAALRLILLTACRPGEIIGLRLKEIHAEDEEPHLALSGARTKSAKGRRVPLSALALAIIKDQRSRLEDVDTSYLFPMGGRPAQPSSRWWIAQAVLRLRAHLGEDADWTPHDLRRTAASLAGDAGTRGEDIKALLGHSDTSVTAVYNRHDRGPALRKAVEGIEAAVRKAAGLRD